MVLVNDFYKKEFSKNTYKTISKDKIDFNIDKIDKSNKIKSNNTIKTIYKSIISFIQKTLTNS